MPPSPTPTYLLCSAKQQSRLFPDHAHSANVRLLRRGFVVFSLFVNSPRYKLLLQEYIRYTDEGHPDYKGLDEVIFKLCLPLLLGYVVETLQALAKVDEVAKRINDDVRYSLAVFFAPVASACSQVRAQQNRMDVMTIQNQFRWR